MISRPTSSSSSTTSSAPSRTAPPTQPPAKSSLAAPMLDKNEVEMGTLSGSTARSDGGAGGDDISEGHDSDIMHLARIGDIAGLERLFESGAYDITHADSEGITPLHWAAINNQYAMCKFLLDHGAAVDPVGGISQATPLQWAAQRSHYYTANLLLRHNADPFFVDGEGYTTLHTATFAGNVLLVILLLHNGVPVDVVDRFGHTGLMWSAYKGFPQLVDVFLRWGADVHATDELGFTSLHWALVKGNPGCVQKLVEYGADRFTKTSQGKTPAMVAEEHNSTRVWSHALAECGYGQDGNAAEPALPGVSLLLNDPMMSMTRFLFFVPFVMVWLATVLLAYPPIYFGLPLAVASCWGIMQIVLRVMEYAPSDLRRFHKTPWMSGIFAGCLALVGINWLFVVLPSTTRGSSSHPTYLLNLVFAILYGLVVFYYVATMRADPGFVPRLNGIAEQKAVIDELLSLWKFDETNFCVACMIRTPVRSKHCRRCHRCVARHDHHCPWVYNCVGVNNHRHFFFYIIYLCLGILAYDWILYYYFSDVSPAASDVCNVLSPSLCRVVNSSPYTLVLAIAITTQLSWVVMLLFVQLVQVSRGMTTYENMYGITEVSTALMTSTNMPLDPNHPGAPAVPAPRHGHHGHRHAHGHGGCLRNITRLLGVEPFIETVRGTGAATKKQQRRKNPFSRGCVTNCKDFWCDPAPVFGTRDNGVAMLDGSKVNYVDMYESPMAMMALGRRRGAYEAVAGDEV